MIPTSHRQRRLRTMVEGFDPLTLASTSSGITAEALIERVRQRTGSRADV